MPFLVERIAAHFHRIAVVAVAVWAMPGLAGATTISFTGTPSFMNLSSGASGVDRNSVLTGTLEFTDAYHGGAFDVADVRSIGLQIGSLDFRSPGRSGNARLSGNTSNDGTVLEALSYQLALPLANADCAGCSLNLALNQSPNRFSASYNTLRHGSGILTGGFSASASSVPDDDTDIPEPPGWLLSGLGVILIGWGARRRRLARRHRPTMIGVSCAMRSPVQ